MIIDMVEEMMGDRIDERVKEAMRRAGATPENVAAILEMVQKRDEVLQGHHRMLSQMGEAFKRVIVALGSEIPAAFGLTEGRMVRVEIMMREMAEWCLKVDAEFDRVATQWGRVEGSEKSFEKHCAAQLDAAALKFRNLQSSVGEWKTVLEEAVKAGDAAVQAKVDEGLKQIHESFSKTVTELWSVVRGLKEKDQVAEAQPIANAKEAAKAIRALQVKVEALEARGEVLTLTLQQSGSAWEGVTQELAAQKEINAKLEARCVALEQRVASIPTVSVQSMLGDPAVLQWLGQFVQQQCERIVPTVGPLGSTGAESVQRLAAVEARLEGLETLDRESRGLGSPKLRGPFDDGMDDLPPSLGGPPVTGGNPGGAPMGEAGASYRFDFRPLSPPTRVPTQTPSLPLERRREMDVESGSDRLAAVNGSQSPSDSEETSESDGSQVRRKGKEVDPCAHFVLTREARRDPGVQRIRQCMKMGIELQEVDPVEMVRLNQAYGMYPDGVHPFGPPVGGRKDIVRERKIQMVPRMMGVPPVEGAVLSDMWISAVGTQRPEPFSGREADWEAFTERWGRYARTLQHSQAGAVADHMWFQVLEPCLDEVGRNLMSMRLKQEPTLKFAKFWRELERIYVGDRQAHRRAEWLRVSLGGAQQLTADQFRIFTSQFQMRRARMDEPPTEEETESRLMAELPQFWRDRVFHENAKRARNTCWVKVMKPLPIEEKKLLRLLKVSIKSGPVKVEEGSGHMFVDCRTPEDLESVLGMDGYKFPAGKLSVKRATRRLSWEEIIHLVSTDLRVQGELQWTPVEAKVQAVYEGEKQRVQFGGGTVVGSNQSAVQATSGSQSPTSSSGDSNVPYQQRKNRKGKGKGKGKGMRAGQQGGQVGGQPRQWVGRTQGAPAQPANWLPTFQAPPQQVAWQGAVPQAVMQAAPRPAQPGHPAAPAGFWQNQVVPQSPPAGGWQGQRGRGANQDGRWQTIGGHGPLNQQGRGAAGGRGSIPKDVWDKENPRCPACKKQGKPNDHQYWRCPVWLQWQDETLGRPGQAQNQQPQGVGGQGDRAFQGLGGAQSQAAASSTAGRA